MQQTRGDGALTAGIPARACFQVLNTQLVKHRRLPGQSLTVLGVLREQLGDTLDTSSAAAGSTATVAGAAAAWAALRFEPMVAKSVAAAVIVSGAAITNDIPHLQATQDNPTVG